MPLLSTSERPGPLLGLQQLLKVLLFSSLAAPALVLAIYGVLSYFDTFHRAGAPCRASRILFRSTR